MTNLLVAEYYIILCFSNNTDCVQLCVECIFIHIFACICWSCRMAALVLCYYAVAPVKMASVLVLVVIFRDLFQLICIQVGLNGISLVALVVYRVMFPFYFAASCVRSMNLRQLTVSMSLLSIVLPIYFQSVNCLNCLRKVTNCFFQR